jgi:hypothetical protein
MCKRKKHPSGLRLQKELQLQHKIDFVKRLKVFATLYCGKEAASLLIKQRTDAIYQQRVHTLKLLVADDSKIEPCHRKDIEAIFLKQIKAETVKTPDGTDVSLSDYLRIGLSLSMHISRTRESKSPADISFTNAFATYQDRFFEGENVHKRLYDISFAIGILLLNLAGNHYWINPTLEFKCKDDGSALLYVELHKAPPEKAMFMIDGQPRPAFKLNGSWPGNGLFYIKLRPSELGITGNNQDIPLDVSIQSHALQRLSERIDTISFHLAHFFVLTSLLEPKAITDSCGRILIEYRVDKFKAGYLRADIINGSILIRTFLFLTNNGTPEGKKLEQMTGLGKLDKKYLAIDKLSAFMSSDIRSNEAVMEIIRKAGCENLLDLHKHMKHFLIKHNECQHTGELLAKYLSLMQEKEQTIPEPAL